MPRLAGVVQSGRRGWPRRGLSEQWPAGVLPARSASECIC